MQVVNVATLPGIVRASYAMPDVHWGYGFPIGGVAATDVDNDGVVSPGGVGFDISCGVRLLVGEGLDPVPASLIPVAAVVGTVRTGVGVRNRAGVDPVCPGQTGATLPAGTTGPEPVGITAVAARAGHPAQDTRHGRPTLSAGTAIAQQHPAGTAITTGRPGPTQTPNTAIADQ